MSKKSIGNFLKNAARQGKGVTEEELLGKDDIIPDDVLQLRGPTKSYLCKTTDNVYGIEFTAFKLRDMDSGNVLFEVEAPEDMEYVPPSEDDDDSGRFVQYKFSRNFFSLRTVGASITFNVGKNPVPNFRMIERHFFRNRLIKSFDFDFGFCIPESKNSCEHIYEVPKLTASDVDDMVAHPYETRSDSFYFVDGKLMMHNRAEYAYS
eukprot:m.137419 g.137419  ORF g.137419 m.137419 type:complete len:207 (+) comp11703_c0_seq1:122-742(+)